jgi:hypothetical protein
VGVEWGLYLEFDPWRTKYLCGSSMWLNERVHRGVMESNGIVRLLFLQVCLLVHYLLCWNVL